MSIDKKIDLVTKWAMRKGFSEPKMTLRGLLGVELSFAFRKRAVLFEHNDNYFRLVTDGGDYTGEVIMYRTIGFQEDLNKILE